MDRDPLLAKHYIPSHLLGYNIQTAGHIRIIFYCIIPTCLELLAYIIHMTADFALSYQHFYEKNSLYGGLTLLFVCLPAFIWFILILLSPVQWPDTISIKQFAIATTTTTTTAATITNDACCNSSINGGSSRIRKYFQNLTKKDKWKFFGKILLNLIVFPLTAIYRFSYKIFWSIEALFHKNGTYEHNDSITNACKSSPFELYHFVQAYAQSAPQIILQLYIILRQDIFRNYETTNLQVLSIIFSIINMATITSSYQRFESQKKVGRPYPWASLHQIQNHKEKFCHSTSVTEISRQSLENNRKRQRKSDYFPENDNILQKLQLDDEHTRKESSNQSISDTNTTASKLRQNNNEKPEENKNVFNFNHNDDDDNFDRNSDTNFTDDDSDDEINNNHRDMNEPNNKDYEKYEKRKRNKNRVGHNKGIEITANNEGDMTHLEHENEKFLASSNCIDPISKRDTLNVTDDEKLKNCQKNERSCSGNNKNNIKYYQRTISQPDDEDLDEEIVNVNENGNKFHGSVAPPLSDSTSSANRKYCKSNLDDPKNFTTEKNQHQELENDEKSETLEKENEMNKNFKKYPQENNSTLWALANAIEYLGEEDIDSKELEKYQKQHKKLRNIKFSDQIDYDFPYNNSNIIDMPPQSPPPPPPPTAASRTPSTSNTNNTTNLNPFDLLFSKSDNSYNKRNSNPLRLLSIYKDMLIFNTENYIVDNVPHPPQFICNRVDLYMTTTDEQKKSQKDYKEKLTTHKYKLEKFHLPNKLHSQHSKRLSGSSASPFTLSNQGSEQFQPKPTVEDMKLPIKSSEDTVDFFLPSRRKMLYGIEQDDFFGKCTGFFGWFMFIYMRIVSLSVFSVFYQTEFFYLILGHYLLMLICLCTTDKDNFKKNLKKIPFFVFLAYVYIFVILEFKTRFKRVKLWYIGYFIIVMTENFTMTFLWKSCVDTAGNESLLTQEFELNTYWWFNFLFLTTWGSFFVFINCLFVYYVILKPNNVILVEKE